MSCILKSGDDPAGENIMYELPKSLSRRWFDEGRYGRLGTIGDGSCFFHSLAYGLNLENYIRKNNAEKKEIALHLRKQLSDNFDLDNYQEIKKTIKNYSKSFDDIKKNMAILKIWADEMMIKWASKFMEINVVFVDLAKDSNTVYCGVHHGKLMENLEKCEDPNVKTVVIAWINHSHFELLVRIDQIHSDHVDVRMSFNPSNDRDLVTIRNLMSAYKNHCKL